MGPAGLTYSRLFFQPGGGGRVWPPASRKARLSGSFMKDMSLLQSFAFAHSRRSENPLQPQADLANRSLASSVQVFNIGLQSMAA